MAGEIRFPEVGLGSALLYISVSEAVLCRSLHSVVARLQCWRRRATTAREDIIFP